MTFQWSSISGGTRVNKYDLKTLTHCGCYELSDQWNLWVAKLHFAYLYLVFTVKKKLTMLCWYHFFFQNYHIDLCSIKFELEGYWNDALECLVAKLWKYTHSRTLAERCASKWLVAGLITNSVVDKWIFPVGWCSLVRIKWKLIAWKNSWRTRSANEHFKIKTASLGAIAHEEGNDQQ